MCYGGRVLHHDQISRKHTCRFTATPQTCCGRTLQKLESRHFLTVVFCKHYVMFWMALQHFITNEERKGLTCCCSLKYDAGARMGWALGGGLLLAVMFCHYNVLFCEGVTTDQGKRESTRPDLLRSCKNVADARCGHWEAGSYWR